MEVIAVPTSVLASKEGWGCEVSKAPGMEVIAAPTSVLGSRVAGRKGGCDRGQRVQRGRHHQKEETPEMIHPNTLQHLNLSGEQLTNLHVLLCF